jgi:CelD/BcsL family acetyltransferase involved in cellulose biosynthesis/glycosyltransferase involved in cell wall biosynthesis
VPLTILSVAYPLAPVGPDAVGGAEQVLSLLDEALVQAGHRSIVVACEGSVTCDVLISTPRVRGAFDASARALAQARHQAAIRQALATHPIDMVHAHGLDFNRYLPPPGVPLLATLHLPPDWYAADVFHSSRPETYLQCVSRSQRSTCPPSTTPLLDPLSNGVPLDRLTPGSRKAGFALVLGRVCPEKGVHLAVQAARLARVPLLLAGQVYPYPAHERYFREILAPSLDDDQVRFVGAIGMARKRRLLALARCLLVPSLAPETSSLVAMESLACGTPVVAFRAGALADIVEHGRTGFLVNTSAEMASALADVGSIDPAACRQAAEERYAAKRMAAQYLVLYSRLAARPPTSLARSSGAPVLEIEEVTDLGGLAAVRNEWSDLWDRCLRASIFQHPDWLIPWCAPFGVHEPWVLLLRHRKVLVAVVPLLVYRRGEERVLTLMGGGVSDDQDAIFDPALAGAAVTAALAHMYARHDQWDVCELENLRPESPLVQTSLRFGALAGYFVRHDTRLALALPEQAEDLEHVIPKRMLDNIKYLQRRANRDAVPASIETVTPRTLAAMFDDLTRLHRARWALRGRTGVLTDRLEAFHREAAQALLERGLLRMYTLSLGGRVAAATYGFCTKGRSVYYLGGFDPDFSRYSPGTQLVGHAIERAVTEDHAHTFDFLRGREDYKRAWGATEQPLYRWSMQSPVRSTCCC